MPGLQDRTGGCIIGGTSIDPAWMGTGPPVGEFPATAKEPTDVPGILPEDNRGSDIPSQGMRAQGGGGQQVDPTPKFTLYTAIYGILFLLRRREIVPIPPSPNVTYSSRGHP